MAEAGKVKVKLVVDSNSKKVAAGMKRDLHGIDREAKSTGKHIGTNLSMGARAGATALGQIYAEMARHVLRFGADAIQAPVKAFLEGDQVVRKFAGAFALVDTANHSMKEMRTLSQQVKGELTTMAMAAGVSDAALFKTFTGIVKQGRFSVEQSEKLTESIAFAGRSIAGGPQALGAAFEQLSMGAIRSQSPLASMIAATGQLKGSAREVAQQLQKMDVVKAMGIAEQAVAKMAEKMKKVPLTMDEAAKSLSVLKGDITEEMGKAMAPGITKVVNRVRSAFLDAEGHTTALTDRLYEAAADAGRFLAQAFELGESFVDGFGEGIAIASDEFAIIMTAIFGESDNTFKRMVDFAKSFGQIVGGTIKVFATTVAGITLAIQKTVTFLLNAAGVAAELVGKIPGAEKVGGMGTKARQLAASGEQEDRLAKLGRTDTGTFEQEKLRKAYLRTAAETGVAADVAAKAIADADEKRAVVEDSIAAARNFATTGTARQFFNAYANAEKMHDEAAKKNIARFIENNSEMAVAIGRLGPEILGEAGASFAKTLEQIGSKEAAKAFKAAARPEVKIAKANVTQNFHGGVHVKQDFKEAEPDRILVAFKDELKSAGSSRLQARTATPFGF